MFIHGCCSTFTVPSIHLGSFTVVFYHPVFVHGSVSPPLFVTSCLCPAVVTVSDSSALSLLIDENLITFHFNVRLSSQKRLVDDKHGPRINAE